MDGSITQSIRIPVIHTENYTVFFQAIRINEDYCTFVHCDVREWSAQVLRSLRSDWNTLVDLHNGPLLALNEVGDEKHQHFLELFEFTYLQDIMGEDSTIRRLYIHNNKAPQET
jgi:hypothetical protein